MVVMSRLFAGMVLALCAAPVWAQAQGAPFSDVPRTHWAYDAVEEMRQRGIVRGYPAAKPAPVSPPVKRVPGKRRPVRRGS
jgi:hypothetical protein